jgi:hypothetical protein
MMLLSMEMPVLVDRNWDWDWGIYSFGDFGDLPPVAPHPGAIEKIGGVK